MKKAVLYTLCCVGFLVISCDNTILSHKNSDEDENSVDENAQQCVNEDMQCVGDDVMKCLDGEWRTWTNCEIKGMKCIAEEGVARCYDDEIKDSADSINDSDSANTADSVVDDDTADSVVDDDGGDTTDSAVDEDSGDSVPDEDTSDSGPCRLDSSFLTPTATDYFTLRQTGKVFDYDDTTSDISAMASESKLTVGALSMDGDGGSYLLHAGLSLIFQAHAYEFLMVDQARGVARVQLLTSVGQWAPSLLPSMIDDDIREVSFGAFTSVQENYLDVRFNSSGQITEQNIRRSCMVGISKTEEVEEDGEKYKRPIGKIFGCFDAGQVGAVGETLKMMFNIELNVNEAALLTFINTRNDDTIAQPGDGDYQASTCTCYSLYEKDTNGDPMIIDCSLFSPTEPLFPDED